MNRYIVSHLTRYEYEAPVLYSHHAARLRPRALPWQSVQWSTLEVSPGIVGQHARADYFGNECDFFEVAVEYDCLEVRARSEVSVCPPLKVALDSTPRIPWEQAASKVRASELLSVAELSFDSPLVRRHSMLRSYAEPSFPPGRALWDAVVDLNERIHREFRYDPASTHVSMPLGQAMRQRSGVCQDFAHVAIGCLRSLGLSARYVSGYLETRPPPGQPRLVGADASHAWAGVYVPGYGWLDFDPTNAVLPESRHVTVAFGRDFSDVSPLKGTWVGGSNHALTVAVDVEPVPPQVAAPGVTPP